MIKNAKHGQTWLLTVKMKNKMSTNVKKKVAPVILVLPWYYPGNTGSYAVILGILGTPVFLDLPLATF